MANFLANLRSKALEETNSTQINASTKEMEENRAYFTLLAKKIKKANKNIKGFISAGAEVSIGFAQFAAAVGATQGDGPLANSLERSSAWEYYVGDLLNTLITSLNLKVADSMLEFTKNEIPAAEAVKKKFDQARRDYDNSITKVQQLQKEKKPNPPKIQQAEQERERLKQIYLQRGEEAYNALLDVNEMTSFTTLEKMCTYFEAYYQFFKGGYNWLRDLHDNVLPHYKKVITEEKYKFEQRRRKRPPGEWIPDAISGGASSRTRQFGVPYEELIQRDNPPNGIPIFIEKALDYIEEKCLRVQGIFRVSPPKTQLDEIKKKIDAGKEVNWAELDDHLVTGIVKLFLRELPQPLLTFELYSEFVAANDAGDEAAQVKAITKTIQKLPKGNAALLKRLIRLCCKIEQHKDENKMTASNLAVVLCPSILYAQEPNPLTMVEDIEKANKLMVCMLNKYTEIFGEALPKKSPTTPPASAPKNALPPTKGAPSQSTSNLPANAPPPPTNMPPPPTNMPPPPTTTPPPPSFTPAPPTTAPPQPAATPTPPTTSPPPANTLPQPKPTPAQPEASTVEPAHQAPAQESSPAVPSTVQAGAVGDAGAGQAAPAVNTAASGIDAHLSLNQIKQMLGGAPPQQTYFFQMREIVTALCAFSASTAKPSFGPDDIGELNVTLKDLAKAIKTTLGVVKEYAAKLPNDLAKRLLLAAKGLQDHIMSTANAFKALNEGKSDAAASLVSATKQYIYANYKLIMRVKESCLIDELTLTSETLISRVEALISSFSTVDRAAIAIATNALQGQSFKLSALLRAKALDTESVVVRERLTKSIEAMEKSTQEVTMEVRTMLFDPNQDPKLTDSIRTKLVTMKDIAVEALSLVEQLQSQNNSQVTNYALFNTTIEQLNANIIAHSSNESPTMKAIVAALHDIGHQIGILKATTGLGDVITNKYDWINAAKSITQQIDNIKNIISDASVKATDDGTQATLNAFVQSADLLNILMKIAAPATIYEVKLEAQENIRFMSALKDFVFIMFPFLFALREALPVIDAS